MRELTVKQSKEIENLIKKMTIKEKIGQMNQLTPSIVGGFDVSFEELIEMMTDGRITREEFEKKISGAKQDFHEEKIKQGLIGSMILQDSSNANRLQKIAVEESRLGIPLIFGFDVIHGYRTVFPIPIAEAGSFNGELFKKTAQIAAKESRAEAIHWHFAPMLDVARDARWGRVSEGPGEDPYLSSVFAVAKVQGLQGGANLKEKTQVAACLKHFVAYGACEGGKEYNTTSMSNSQLFNIYLPPFKAAVEAGASTVMAAFNDLNGVPCTTNQFVLRKILKDSYDFKGFVVSDANAVKECVTHGIAEDDKESAYLAANSGLDMDMGTSIFETYLESVVEEKMLQAEVIDESVRRILTVKMQLGLFEKPYTNEDNLSKYDILPSEHRELSRQAGRESIVLLKNEQEILPLNIKKKIGVVGELAKLQGEVNGAWAMKGRPNDSISVWQGIQEKTNKHQYFECCGPIGELNENEVQQAINYSDVIVAVVGEYVSMTGEASSKADIALPGMQQEMLKILLASGKPVVVILMNGRPLALSWEFENMPAIIEAWHLGTEMGNAVADVLFGDYNPQGKLSCTFPQVSGQCPVYYNHPNTGRPGSKSKFTSRYLDIPPEPLLPFGYGLSYTKFLYQNMRIVEDENELKVYVTIKNIGSVRGIETAQLYLQDVVASIVRPVKELKGFIKVELEAGSEKEVMLILSKKDMGYYDDNMKYHLENGEYRIFIGSDSKNCMNQSITIEF